MKEVTGKKKPLKKALVQGDTGYFFEENLQEAAKRKINVLIPDQQFRQRDPYFAEKKNEKVETKKKVNTQWQLYCIVHNIGKCMNALAVKMGFRGN